MPNINFDDSQNLPTNNNQQLTPKLSKEEKELLVPQDITSNFKNNHYNPQIMQNIICDIATTHDPITVIVAKYGLTTTTVYWWRSVSSQLMNAWRTAMRHRTHAIADKFEPEVAILDTQVETDDDYKRTSNRIRRFDRVWGHREWFLSRYNRQDFGDKLDIDSNVTVSPAKAREAAYQAFQQAQEAEYEDITLPNINLESNDTSTS